MSSFNHNSNDFDIAIYNQRILQILNRTIARVHTASTVFSTIINPSVEFFANVTTNETIKDKLIFLKQRYSATSSSGDMPVQSNAGLQQISNGDLIIDLIEFFEQNLKIQAHSKKTLQHHQQYQVFVKCLTELRNSVAAHLEENISQERAREEQLQTYRLKNEQAAKEIAALEKELAEKKSDFNASIMGKNLLVNRHQNKIEKIRKVTQEAIDKRAGECQAAIDADNAACDAILMGLQEELQETTRKYEEQLKLDLEEEKRLRRMRREVEDRLGLYLQSLDQDLSEKQVEEEKLQAECDGEKKKYEEIQKKLDEQEEEYDELMQEKAAYEQQLVEQKLFLFILNRSARRIQRAFRAYKLRKLAKKAKKGKKGKGKKK